MCIGLRLLDEKRLRHERCVYKYLLKQALLEKPKQGIASVLGSEIKDQKVDKTEEMSLYQHAITVANVAAKAIDLSFSSFISLKRVKSESSFKYEIIASVIVPFLVTIEWLLGYYVLISLAATLTNTIPVLSELIRQLR